MQAEKISGRYKYPVSDKELDRRLAATQAALQAAGLDCAVTQNFSHIFDGTIRYYIDIPTHDYSLTLLIPAEGKMTLIKHGPDSGENPIKGNMRNVERIYVKPFCQPFPFTNGMAAKCIAKEIRDHGYKKVGLIGVQLMSYDFGSYLRDDLPTVAFSDFTQGYLDVCTVKSEEEWELIDLSVRCHERLMEAVPAIIAPGRLECEVRADLEHMARMMGCDNIGNIAVGCDKPDHPCQFVTHIEGNRRIERGDNVCIMIEVSGPGGMYGEDARTFTLGTPSDKLVRLFEIAKGCQEAVAAAAKPGVTGNDLSNVFDNYILNIEPTISLNLRNAGHSQGYDMMQSPAIARNDFSVVKENMFFSIHPELTGIENFAICCDNFRITRNGAVRLTKTPQKIFQLDV